MAGGIRPGEERNNCTDPVSAKLEIKVQEKYYLSSISEIFGGRDDLFFGGRHDD